MLLAALLTVKTVFAEIEIKIKTNKERLKDAENKRDIKKRG